LTHLERDLQALVTSRFAGNREFAQQVSEILAIARTVYRDYQAGKLSQEALASQRPVLVAQMFSLLETVRLQSGDVVAQLCELLSLAGRSPPGLHAT